MGKGKKKKDIFFIFFCFTLLYTARSEGGYIKTMKIPQQGYLEKFMTMDEAVVFFFFAIFLASHCIHIAGHIARTDRQNRFGGGAAAERRYLVLRNLRCVEERNTMPSESITIAIQG